MSTKTETGSNKSTFIWIGAGVVVVVALFAWAIASGGANSGNANYEVPAFGEIDVAGSLQPLDPTSAGIAEFDPATGQPAPVAIGTDYNGEPSSIGDSGEPQIIAFLAHWCSHCQAEVPRLVTAMAGGSTIDGVEVVGVATATNSTRGNYPPAAWLDAEGWTGGVLMDNSESAVLQVYGLGSFPAWAAVKADGTIAARATGELSEEQVSQLAALAQG